MEREEVAVDVHGFGLRPDRLELGVLVRWLEGRRCEVGAVGGGVGDASFGSTHDRSCLGRAISSASSIWAWRLTDEGLGEQSVQLSSFSSAARVERVMARGKFGAKVERMRWLRRLEEQVGSREDDSE